MVNKLIDLKIYTELFVICQLICFFNMSHLSIQKDIDVLHLSMILIK
jgi:hypothetical protein